MTPGQVAHDAGGFERKWERMGESQKADWERIAQAVLQAQPVQPATDNSAEIARLQKASEKIDAKARWINDEQAIVDYTKMMKLRAALKGVCAAIAQPVQPAIKETP